MPNIATETDLHTMRQVALLQERHIHQLTKRLAEAHAQLAELTGENRLQAELALVEALAAAATSQPPSVPADPTPKQPKDEPQRGHGATEQPELQQEELVCPLPEDLTCPTCGETLERAPGLDQRSEVIDVVEVRYVLRKVVREAAACRCGACLVVAPGPDRVTPGGRYSLDFGLKIALDKYLAHLPLTRQEAIMGRHGLNITSQTLWDQLQSLAEELLPTWKAIRAHILEGPVIGVDQTPWPNLEQKTAKPWQMWALTRDDAIWHGIMDDKGMSTFEKLLGRYQGVIVADMMSTHLAAARRLPGITLAACWAHVLRKFRDAAEAQPEASFALEHIDELYAIDAEATNDDHRRQLRQTRSTELLDQLKTWLLRQRPLKTSALGRAIRYTLTNWDHLRRFTTDPRIWLDNNPTERALRGPVVGRRNHFGSKSRAGTQVAAVFYTLIETAKARKVNPATYLRDAILAARQGQVLLPGA